MPVDRVMGRLYVPDNRDLDYRLRSLLPTAPVKVVTKKWKIGSILDQGQTSECVAYAWTEWLSCMPTPTLEDQAYIEAFYTDAQVADGIPGPHDGTTVRAGAEIMQQQGRLVNYYWDTDANAVREWIITKGPVVLGTNWYVKMFRCDATGLITIGGELAGGHAYLCYGYDAALDQFLCQNSWSTRWGFRGTFRLKRSTLARLLRENGEACAAVEVSVPIAG